MLEPRSFEPLGDLDRRVLAGQAHEVAIGRVRLCARRIGMFIQEAMKSELYDKPFHSFGGRVDHLGFDFAKRIDAPSPTSASSMRLAWLRTPRAIVETSLRFSCPFPLPVDVRLTTTSTFRAAIGKTSQT